MKSLTPEAEAALRKQFEKWLRAKTDLPTCSDPDYCHIAWETWKACTESVFQRTVEAAAQQIFTRMEKHNLTIATDLRDAIRNLTVEQVLGGEIRRIEMDKTKRALGQALLMVYHWINEDSSDISAEQLKQITDALTLAGLLPANPTPASQPAAMPHDCLNWKNKSVPRLRKPLVGEQAGAELPTSAAYPLNAQILLELDDLHRRITELEKHEL